MLISEYIHLNIFLNFEFHSIPMNFQYPQKIEGVLGRNINR